MTCNGCKREIDPNVCHCGTSVDDHRDGVDGHGFVAMGCDCLRDPDSRTT